MKLKKRKWFVTAICLLSIPVAVCSQESDSVRYRLSLNEAIEMGLQNHQQLKISKANVAVQEQQVEVSKLQQLPSVTFSANAFYLGDAVILDTDFSKLETVEMPHFGNTFAIQASQLLYKGGVIKKSIELAELQKQLAELDMAANEQDIKFLIISNYLDIYKLLNQAQVLEQNKILAEQLLENITKLFEQNMVTRNELIRSELQIKNLEQSILTIHNNHAILSNQLSYALGLPNDIIIIPSDSVDEKIVYREDYYVKLAYLHHPALQSSKKDIEIGEKNVNIIKTDRFPAISAFAGYNMQRPLTSSTPVIDLYNNTWQAGISLSYNIDDLFRTKQKTRLGKNQVLVSQEAFIFTQQNVEIGVKAAFIKYQEAVKQALLMEESTRLANENYNIIKAKYLNQLAITAEMTDASNAKLEAELQYANANINVLFQYYNLLKSTGTL